MKFQALYDEARKRGIVFVRIEDNLIPFDGWFVQSGGQMRFLFENFDDIVSYATSTSKHEYIAVTKDGSIMTGDVFGVARKEYAMGYAHGAGLDGIYDVGTGKLIRRK